MKDHKFSDNKFDISGKLPSLNTNLQLGWWDSKPIANLDLSNDNTYSEMTVCFRANLRSFFGDKFSVFFRMFSSDVFTVEDYYAYFGVHEPRHTNSLLGKQVRKKGKKTSLANTRVKLHFPSTFWPELRGKLFFFSSNTSAILWSNNQSGLFLPYRF